MGLSDVLSTPPGFPVTQRLVHRVLISDGNSGNEKRLKKWSGPKRVFDIRTSLLSPAELKTLRDFWIARDAGFDVFSFLPPANIDRTLTALSVGTGDGIETEFEISGANDLYYYRVYTGAGNLNQAYVDGSPVSATFANTDGSKSSKVTYDSAPGGSTALTVDIDRYVICRFLTDEIETALILAATASARYSFTEVFRDSI